MLTFHTMGTSGTMAVGAMIGLSLALKATAVGLLVAIPCVVLNNVLRRKSQNSSRSTRFSMEREFNQINVIPLVDVMLVLLVIVLTTATFISTGQLPVDSQGKGSRDHKENPLVITLTADGRLFLNDQPVEEDNLKTMSRRTLGSRWVGARRPDHCLGTICGCRGRRPWTRLSAGESRGRSIMTTLNLSRLTGGNRPYQAHGWTVSLLCHVLVVGCAIAVIAESRTRSPDTFHWEVSVVERPSPVKQYRLNSLPLNQLFNRPSRRSNRSHRLSKD